MEVLKTLRMLHVSKYTVRPNGSSGMESIRPFLFFRGKTVGFLQVVLGMGFPAFRICQAAGVPMQSNEVPVGVGHGGSFRLVSTKPLENQLEVGL